MNLAENLTNITNPVFIHGFLIQTKIKCRHNRFPTDSTKMLDYNKPCNNISKKLQNVNKPHKHTFF